MSDSNQSMNDKLEARMKLEEIKANMMNSYVAFFVMLILAILYVLGLFSVYSINAFLLHIGFCTSIGCLFCSIFLTHYFHGEKAWNKYLLLICSIIVATICFIQSGGTIPAILLLPVLSSIRYFRRRLLVIASVVSLLLLLAIPFVDALWLPQLGLVDLNSLANRGDYSFVSGDDSWQYQIVIGSNIDKSQLFWNTLIRSALPTLGLLALLFLYGYEFIKHSRKLIVEAMEKGEAQTRIQQELSETKSKILISRLQPDFIYDSLDSIMSIPGNPEATVQAIDDFGEFIKENLDSLDESENVPFQKELSHVERYLRLLELSKRKGIKVELFIDEKDFLLPSLSLLTLVQYAYSNQACDHIVISTKLENGEILIEVHDNGLVFDKAILSDQKGRVSINSLQERISSIGGGYLQMKSSQKEGNFEIIHLPCKKTKKAA